MQGVIDYFYKSGKFISEEEALFTKFASLA